jgi:putative flippase GtrA
MAQASLPKALFDWLKDAWRNRAVSVKAVSFALVGLVNTAVDYTVFLSARALLSGWPAALSFFNWLSVSCHCGRPESILLVASNLMSWSVAVTGSYVMNSTFTFAAESGRKLRWRRYLTFVVSSIAGLIVNTATLVFAAQVLLLPIWLAKAIAILVGFFINFSLSHFVVFRVRGEPAGEAGEGV